MKRALAASIAVVFALPLSLAAAAAPPEPAAVPFPVVALPHPPTRSHPGAWASLGAGAGLVTASFLIHERANRAYHDYLTSTDPTRIAELYDRTTNLDHLSAGSLIAGEVFLAAGVYLRFLRAPGPPRMTWEIGPDRCLARWRF